MGASAKGVPDLMSLKEQLEMLMAGLVETDDTVDFDLVERAGDLEEEASEKD